MVPSDRIGTTVDLAERIEQAEDDIVALAMSGSSLRAAPEQLGYHSLQSGSA